MCQKGIRAAIDELNGWSDKLLVKPSTLPELADVTSDLEAAAPRLQISINRDQPLAATLRSLADLYASLRVSCIGKAPLRLKFETKLAQAWVEQRTTITDA